MERLATVLSVTLLMALAGCVTEQTAFHSITRFRPSSSLLSLLPR
jgi:hypothetical protein